LRSLCSLFFFRCLGVLCYLALYGLWGYRFLEIVKSRPRVIELRGFGDKGISRNKVLLVYLCLDRSRPEALRACQERYTRILTSTPMSATVEHERSLPMSGPGGGG